MLWFLLAATAAAQQPAANPVQSLLHAAHRDFRAQRVDKFAETTVDPALSGKGFNLALPIDSGDSSGGTAGPIYTYEGGALRLVFDLETQWAGSVYDHAPEYEVGSLGGTRTSERSYVGQNGFGATARVSVTRLEENGIAMLRHPEPEISPFATPGSQLASRNTYWIEVRLPGPEARKLAHDAALVVEGTIAPLQDGKLTWCKSIYIAPEVGTPTEIYGEQCLVGAYVRRVAFIRRSTGELLKEWTKP